MDPPTRRSFLRRSGVVLGAALAGCIDRDRSGSPTAEPPTQTRTPTDTPTESQTPTETDEQVAWTFETDGPIASTPAVADGSAFVPSEDGTLYALAETTGEVRWRIEAEQAFQAASIAHDGTVLARSGEYGLGGDQVVHAIDSGTGEVRWRHEESWWLEVIGSRDGVAYVATEDDAIDSSGETLYALDLDDGTELWSAEIGDPSGGLVTDEAVYVPSYGRLYAFDADSGDQWWTADLSRYYFRTIAAVGDVVCYADDVDDQRGVLRARDASTGELAWEHDDWFVSSTTRHDGTLLVGGERVAAFDSSGDVRWQLDESGFVPRAPVRDGVLYAGGDQARAIDVEDGSVRWSWTPDVSVQGLVPAAAGHGAAYFDSYRDGDPRNKYKFAVEADSGESRWTFGSDTELTDLALGDERVVAGGEDGFAYGLGP